MQEQISLHVATVENLCAKLHENERNSKLGFDGQLNCGIYMNVSLQVFILMMFCSKSQNVASIQCILQASFTERKERTKS